MRERVLSSAEMEKDGWSGRELLARQSDHPMLRLVDDERQVGETRWWREGKSEHRLERKEAAIGGVRNVG